MSKLNKVTWMGAGGSPNKHVLPAISIPIGKRKVVLVKCVQEGRVERVYVKQKSGTNVAFDVRVQCSKVPYGDETSNAAYNDALTVDPELFEVIGKQSAISGAAVDYRDPVGEEGRPFINEDSDTQSNRERKLYVVIIPANTSDLSTWEATIVTVTNHQA